MVSRWKSKKLRYANLGKFIIFLIRGTHMGNPPDAGNSRSFVISLANHKGIFFDFHNFPSDAGNTNNRLGFILVDFDIFMLWCAEVDRLHA